MNQLSIDGFVFYVFWGSVFIMFLGVVCMIGEWFDRKRRGR